MSRFSIRARLIFLAVLLLAVLIVSIGYLTRGLATGAQALEDEARFVSALKTADAARKDFGDLKYWLTDLALSLLVRSDHNSLAARRDFDADLKGLAGFDAQGVGAMQAEVDMLMQQASKAIEAYTNEERVIGNALMAK